MKRSESVIETKGPSPFSEEVDSLLRKLYALGMDWLVVDLNGREWAIHKDRLVSFIAMGLGSESIESMLEKKGSLIKSEEDGPKGKVLFLDKKGLRIEDYTDKESELPPWWSVPLPLVCIKSQKAVLNPRASDCFGSIALTDRDRRSLTSRGELIISVKDKRIYLSRMEENFYLAEDVSGDFSLAEDVGWWAAVGKALFERLRSQGFSVERKDRKDRTDDGSETVVCSWDREIMGYLKIRKKKRDEVR